MTMTLPPRPLALILLVLPITGCATHSDYPRPAMATPASWPHASAETSAKASDLSGRWWTAFGDERLDALVERVIARNPDLAAATIAVRRAQLQAGLVRYDQLPQLSAGGSASATRALDSGPTSSSFSASASVSYEVDLWNRLGSLTGAAQWAARATQQDLEATRLALIGTTASLYYQSAWLHDRLDLNAQSIDTARRTLMLIEAQYDAGATSGLELAEARQSLETQEASRTTLLQQQVETTNAITALLDGEEATPYIGSGLTGIEPPPVAAGVPASLLARRPDLRAAEMRLRSSLADVDAATAAFYPTLSLTGQTGDSSSSLSKLLSDPVGTLLASITVPFLNYERVRLNRAISRADYDAAVATFRGSFRTALADVDNALSSRTQLREQGERLQRSLDAARTAEYLYEVRYRAGAVALNDWLSAQEKRRSAEAALLENRYSRLDNHIILLQALGGGPVIDIGGQSEGGSPQP